MQKIFWLTPKAHQFSILCFLYSPFQIPSGWGLFFGSIARSCKYIWIVIYKNLEKANLQINWTIFRSRPWQKMKHTIISNMCRNSPRLLFGYASFWHYSDNLDTLSTLLFTSAAHNWFNLFLWLDDLRPLETAFRLQNTVATKAPGFFCKISRI